MIETTLTPAQQDMAQRLGKTAAILALSANEQSLATSLPAWVCACLKHLAEATAQNAGEAFLDIRSPFTAGFALGNMSVMAGLIRNPIERFGTASVGEWMNVYFGSYFGTLSSDPNIQIPQNFWAEFAQQIFALFVSLPYDDRRKFIEGMNKSLDAESNLRTGEGRETTATPVYIELLLFWPEIVQMRNLTEVYRFLQTRFSDTPGVLGDDERFRKAANRIGLSFRQQVS